MDDDQQHEEKKRKENREKERERILLMNYKEWYEMKEEEIKRKRGLKSLIRRRDYKLVLK